jgi:hypothetical protein
VHRDINAEFSHNFDGPRAGTEHFEPVTGLIA